MCLGGNRREPAEETCQCLIDPVGVDQGDVGQELVDYAQRLTGPSLADDHDLSCTAEQLPERDADESNFCN